MGLESVVVAFGDALPFGCGKDLIGELMGALPASANVTCLFNERLVATLYERDYENLVYPFLGYAQSEVQTLDISVKKGGSFSLAAYWALVVFAILCAVISFASWSVVMYLQCKR